MSENDIATLTALILDLKKDIAALNAKVEQQNLAMSSRMQQAETDIGNLYQANSVVRLGEKNCQEEMNAKIDAIVSVTKTAVDSKDEDKKFWNKLWSKLIEFWNGLHISVKWATFILPWILSSGFPILIAWLSAHGHHQAANAVQHVATYVATAVVTPTVLP